MDEESVFSIGRFIECFLGKVKRVCLVLLRVVFDKWVLVNYKEG